MMGDGNQRHGGTDLVTVERLLATFGDMDVRRWAAVGGGGFSMEPENPLLDEFVLSLAGASRPRVCFLPTASGDSVDYVARFYRAFSALDCRPADLQLWSAEDGVAERRVEARYLGKPYPLSLPASPAS